MLSRARYALAVPAGTPPGTRTTDERYARRLGFTSADGDVSCEMRADDAECAVRSRSYSPPPVDPDCSAGAWGDAIRLTTRGPSFVCASEVLVGVYPPLPAGRSLRLGGVTCESSGEAVTCRDATYRFSLAKDGYALS